MAVFDHPSGHLKALQVGEGFHSTQHGFDDVCGACIAYECGLVYALHGGLWSNWARAFSKIACSHSLCSSPRVVQKQSKTLCRSAGGGGNCTCGGGVEGRMGVKHGRTKVVDGRSIGAEW